MRRVCWPRHAPSLPGIWAADGVQATCQGRRYLGRCDPHNWRSCLHGCTALPIPSHPTPSDLSPSPTPGLAMEIGRMGWDGMGWEGQYTREGKNASCVDRTFQGTSYLGM